MSGRLVVLVTGASGHIGSAMVRLLRILEVEHRCMDAVAPAGSPIPEGEPWLLGDLTSPAVVAPLREFCRPVTHVVHLASRVTNAKDMAAAFDSQFHLEVLGTLNLLRALSPQTRHVAYASSMTVYGAPDRLPVGEEHPLRPLCVYALCKLAAEQHLTEFSRTRDIPVAVLRLASVYGPGPSKGRAIHKMALRALRGQPPEIYGDGTVQRDYLYVDDACRAALTVSLHGITGPVNVGSGRGTSAAQLASAIARLAGLSEAPRFIQRPLDEQAAASMVFDIRRLVGATQFAPHVTMEDGLTRTLLDLRERLASGKEIVQ